MTRLLALGYTVQGARKSPVAISGSSPGKRGFQVNGLQTTAIFNEFCCQKKKYTTAPTESLRVVGY